MWEGESLGHVGPQLHVSRFAAVISQDVSQAAGSRIVPHLCSQASATWTEKGQKGTMDLIANVLLVECCFASLSSDVSQNLYFKEKTVSDIFGSAHGCVVITSDG